MGGGKNLYILLHFCKKIILNVVLECHGIHEVPDMAHFLLSVLFVSESLKGSLSMLGT